MAETEPVVVGPAPVGRNRRILVLAGVAAALLLAVVVLPGLLFGSDDPEADPFATPTPGGTTTTTTPIDAPEETFEVFTNKNPFEPLVAVAAAPSDQPPPVVDTPTTTIVVDDGGFPFPVDEGGSGEPQPSGEAEGEGDGDTTTTTAPPPPPRQQDRVSLLEVFTDAGGQVVASVRVNDTTHQVAEGDEFAGSYRVLDLNIETRCAQLLFGDDRFGLCEGEETRK